MLFELMDYRMINYKTLLATALFFGLGACSSLDPASDITKAVKLSSPRLDVSFDASTSLHRDPLQAPSVWNGVDPITSETAVQVAFERDVMIRTAMNDIAERRALLVQAEMPPNPVIGLGLGFAVDGMSGAPAMMQVMQQLSWLWKRPYLLNEANADLRSSILNVAERAVDVAILTRTAHVQLVEAQLRVELDEHFSALTEKTFTIMNRLFEEGEASKIDVDRTAVEHAEAYATLSASRQDLITAKISLLSIMGIPTSHTSFTAEGKLSLQYDVPEEHDVITRASIARLDVAKAVSSIDAARARAGFAKTSRIPNVSVGLGWQDNSSGRKSLIPKASIELPIFDNGSAKVALANAEVYAANLNLIQVRRDAVAEARQARIDWIRSIEQAELYEKTVLVPASEAMNLSEAAFQEGVIDVTVVLLVQQREINARRRLLAFKASSATDQLALERAIGGSFDIPITPPNVVGDTSPTNTTDMQEVTS